jgi:hypothetical protein
MINLLPAKNLLLGIVVGGTVGLSIYQYKTLELFGFSPLTEENKF